MMVLAIPILSEGFGLTQAKQTKIGVFCAALSLHILSTLTMCPWSVHIAIYGLSDVSQPTLALVPTKYCDCNALEHLHFNQPSS